MSNSADLATAKVEKALDEWSSRESARQSIVGMSVRAQSALRSIALEENQSHLRRQRAISLLGTFGDPESTGTLNIIAKSDKPIYRCFALHALAEIGTEEALSIFVNKLDDKSVCMKSVWTDPHEEEDVLVCDEAIRLLEHVTGLPLATKAGRNERIKVWKQWWDDRSNQPGKDLDRFPTQLGRLSEFDKIDLKRALSRFKGLRPSGGDEDYFYPAFIWPWGESTHILIEWPKIIVNPGTAVLRLQLLSKNECVGAFEISLGWRKSPGWTTVRNLAPLQNPLLEVSLTGYGDWAGHDYGDIAREYFSITRDGIKLIRLENIFGDFLRNHYHYPNYTIGGVSKPRSEDEALRVLDSNDTCALLETLIWIGGIHAEPSTIVANEQPQELFKVNMESLEEAKLVDRIRTNPKVIAIIRKLSESNDKWIREAAYNALNPKDNEE